MRKPKFEKDKTKPAGYMQQGNLHCGHCGFMIWNDMDVKNRNQCFSCGGKLKFRPQLIKEGLVKEGD
ncbi:MAG: hypothetical protein V3U54_08695 [Thermodesulfobacteriota bacterium]